MGIRGKFIVVISLIGLIIGLSSFVTLESSYDSLIETEAVRIAEIVSTQVVADRAEYTSHVVGKLVRDGTGASRNSQEASGYIPLPAQFVRNVSKRVAEKAGDLYAYSLLSRWNLNEDQGLKDDFDNWAWSQLEEQNEKFQAAPKPGKEGHPWQGVYRFEEVNGAPVLHYMRADPAAAAACVSCHNGYEKRAEVIAVRERDGVSPGKEWDLHELMGGIRITVPVNEVAAAAAAGRNKMLTGLAAIFLLGFGGLLFLIHHTIIKPVESSVNEVAGFSDRVDSVVGCSKDLVLSAGDQNGACSQTLQALGDSDAEGQRKISESIQALAGAANKNAMKAEESAVYCNELDQSFQDLKGRLESILGR